MQNRYVAITAAVFAASPAASAPAVQTIISAIGGPGDAGVISVEAMVVNSGGDAASVPVPSRVAAGLSIGQTRTSVWLDRMPATPEHVAVPAGGFARVRYTLRLPALAAAGGSAILSVRDWSANGNAFAFPEPRAAALAGAPPPSSPTVKTNFDSADADSGNAFLGSLSAYEPIYAVYGPGTNSDARIQISFKYQLLRRRGAGTAASTLDGPYVAYTQRIFWDLGADSAPFRNVDYMPEAFYQLAPRPVGDGLAIGGQAGLRHESNGRERAMSRSLTTLYLQPVASLPLGGFKLSIAPRFWVATGDKKDNPDIRRYRGHTDLFAEIGRDDGLRLSTTSRYNFGSGKGSFNGEATYPLNGLLSGNINLYVIGQVFTGYGENLLDYNRRVDRARIGLAIVR